MLIKKGGVMEKAGKKYGPNLDTIERNSAEAVGLVGGVIPIPDTAKWKKPSEKEEILSVQPYLEIEDSRTGKTTYLQRPIIQRRFWYKEKIAGFPYVLSRGVSYERHFLPVGLIAEMKKPYGFHEPVYCLTDTNHERYQKVEKWVYYCLQFVAGGNLEWNSFFVIEVDLIFELRAYTGRNNGNTIISFIFHSQKEADEFVLPEWAKGYKLEITKDCYGLQDDALSANGFPS